MTGCDCDATDEQKRAGIHETPCNSRTGDTDDASDHYGQ